MTANQAMHPISIMCKTLGVSRSGFYAWRERAPSTRSVADAELTARIKSIHQASRETYGAPRIHAELADEGMSVGRKRVERLMKAAGLKGVSRRKAAHTAIRDDRVRPACGPVDRNFYADGPDQLWVADITYVPTWSGCLESIERLACLRSAVAPKLFAPPLSPLLTCRGIGVTEWRRPSGTSFLFRRRIDQDPTKSGIRSWYSKCIQIQSPVRPGKILGACGP